MPYAIHSNKEEAECDVRITLCEELRLLGSLVEDGSIDIMDALSTLETITTELKLLTE